MIYYKSKDEVALIKESCQIVSQTLEHVAYLIKPGISTKELDDEAESFILSKGGLHNKKNSMIRESNQMLSNNIICTK